ncbi:hypothetical protein RZE82_09410 [Mollicutes bacterium LVI A0039]|nr:hypothetical protein RZE82_09410 [Mollicutes bacterium LVI A0039]
MNKFNLTMSVLVAAVIIFFGFGIVQKVNYKIEAGDTVSISYSMIQDGETYEMSPANVVIGENTNEIFTDNILLGLKAGADLNFDIELTQDVQVDSSGEKVLAEGSTVTIDGKVTEITPKATEEASDVASEENSEANSEESSETISE